MKRRLKLSHIFMIITLLILTALTGCSTKEETVDKETNKEETAKQEKLSELTIQVPTGISIAAPVYKVVEDKGLTDYTDQVTLKQWKNPDELRARISSNQAQVSAVPTYVGANLYNRGMDVKLINTLVWGILYVIGPDGEPVSWEQLKGQTVYVPFKGDMPDLVFQYLLKKNQLEPGKDLKIEYASAPQEVVSLLVAGKAKYAVIPEHLATLSVLKGKKEGKNLAKVMNLQEEWAKVTGKEPRIPQAGILVSGQLAKEHPELISALQQELATSVQFLNEQTPEAAKMIVPYQEGLEAPIIEKIIPSLNLHFTSSQDAKAELEFFFKELSTISPEITGGKLPDEGFYYQE